MNWYFDVLKKYAVFKGRAGRKEYWFFMLFNTIFYISLYILGQLIDSVESLYIIYTIAILIPTLAVTVRRLHDINQSGYILLIALITVCVTAYVFLRYQSDYIFLLAYSILALVFLTRPSQPGENQYDLNQRTPKQIVMPTQTEQAKEKEVLLAAKKYNGKITPVEVAVESSLSVEEAEQILKKMADKGYASLEVSEGGLLFYEFSGFLK